MASEAATAHSASCPSSCCDSSAEAMPEPGSLGYRHQGGRCYRARSAQSAVIAVLTGTLIIVSVAIVTRCHGSHTRTMKMHASECSIGSAVVGLSAQADAAVNLTDPNTTYNNTKNYFDSAFIEIPHYKIEKWPSLFCWLVMQTVDDNPMGWVEEHLVKHQIEGGLGIFQCNDWAVMTHVALALNRWGAHGFPIIPPGKINPWVDVASWAVGGATRAGTSTKTVPRSSAAFHNAWYALRDSEKLPKHDWVVKVDPDAVWFPQRLREHLKVNMPSHGNGWDSIFMKNCERFGSMQGPIEVISKKAAHQLVTSMSSCANRDGLAEDKFTMDCLQHLGVNSYMDKTMLNDKYCGGTSDCTDHWRVAFHPHKSVGDFTQCYNQALWAELTHYKQKAVV